MVKRIEDGASVQTFSPFFPRQIVGGKRGRKEEKRPKGKAILNIEEESNSSLFGHFHEKRILCKKRTVGK